jgi:hypothetical protein
LGFRPGAVVLDPGSAAVEASGRPAAIVVPTKLALHSIARREIGFMGVFVTIVLIMLADSGNDNRSSPGTRRPADSLVVAARQNICGHLC